MTKMYYGAILLNAISVIANAFFVQNSWISIVFVVSGVVFLPVLGYVLKEKEIEGF